MEFGFYLRLHGVVFFHFSSVSVGTPSPMEETRHEPIAIIEIPII